MLMKFIGKDSLGYKNNHIYNINIEIRPYKNKNMIWIICNNGISCPYESINAFNKNWVQI